MYPTTTEVGIKAQTLCDLLITTSIGETVPFSNMSKAIGQDVRNLRYVLEIARRRLLSEYGMRFDSVYRIGLKRMNINDVVGVADRTLAKVRRTARLENKRIGEQLNKANDIDDNTRFQINQRISLLGAIAELSSPRSLSVVKAAVDERVIPFGRVLELFH